MCCKTWIASCCRHGKVNFGHEREDGESLVLVAVWCGMMVLCDSAASIRDKLVEGCDVGRRLKDVVLMLEG